MHAQELFWVNPNIVAIFLTFQKVLIPYVNLFGGAH